MLTKIRDLIGNALISLVDGALEELPENTDQFLKLAKIKYRAADFSGAIDSATFVIENDKSNGDAFYWRARAHAEIGNFDDALADICQDAVLRPQNSATFHLMGNIYSRRRDYQNALGAYSVAIDTDKNNRVALVGRGFAHYCLNNMRAALVDLELASQMGYSSDAMTQCLADIHTKLQSADNKSLDRSR